MKVHNPCRNSVAKRQGKKILLRDAFMFQRIGTSKAKAFIKVGISNKDTPFGPYSYGTQSHPDEHVLQLPPEELMEILFAAYSMGSTPHCEVFDDFVIQPVYLCGLQWNG